VVGVVLAAVELRDHYDDQVAGEVDGPAEGARDDDDLDGAGVEEALDDLLEQDILDDLLEQDILVSLIRSRCR